MVRSHAAIVAQEPVNVLVRGETGSGKELVAKIIHQSSARSAMPCCTVNCAAIPDGLIESELFGHAKGSFTSATSEEKGVFQAAHGGTVILDEIGDMNFASQARLLRFLNSAGDCEHREVKIVGSARCTTVNVRVVSSTNKNLEALVKEGHFRADLYHRINGFTIIVPPLRERTEDMPVLIESFRQERRGKAIGFSWDAIKKLSAYHWPGNVRELQNVVISAEILACAAEARNVLPLHIQFHSAPEYASGCLSGPEVDAIPSDLRNIIFGNAPIPEDFSLTHAMRRVRSAFEKPLIEKVLSKTSWNTERAAMLLGISVKALRYKRMEHELGNNRGYSTQARAAKASS